MRTILVTNDDGIGAAGLERLALAAAEFGEVWVIAPDGQRSAASHSISLHDPVDIIPYGREIAPGVKAFSCSGSAADCVRIGIISILPRRPDVVLSGINHGCNIGSDIQYSATAGAAFESVFLGTRAIAFSEEVPGTSEISGMYVGTMLAELIDEEPPERSIINVNFPSCRPEELKGILRGRSVSRMSSFKDHYNVIAELEGGGKRYMVEGEYNKNAEDGTDFRAVLDKYISVGYVKNIS